MNVLLSVRQGKNQHGADIDIIEHAYIEYLQKFGISIVIVPNKISEINWDGVEGVIISGGNDINPASYGGSMEGLSLAPDRDKVERKLVEGAIERRLPILGICRGMQFLNVFFGGKIVDFKTLKINHPIQHHTLTVSGKLEQETTVNSYHTQGIRSTELGEELDVFATSGEIVEGFSHTELPIAGIQWHPERESPDEEFNSALLRAFVNKELFWKR